MEITLLQMHEMNHKQIILIDINHEEVIQLRLLYTMKMKLHKIKLAFLKLMLHIVVMGRFNDLNLVMGML